MLANKQRLENLVHSHNSAVHIMLITSCINALYCTAGAALRWPTSSGWRTRRTHNSQPYTSC
jgi:hypothetical protein